MNVQLMFLALIFVVVVVFYKFGKLEYRIKQLEEKKEKE